MIFVTRLDGRQLVVQGDAILTIEETPDTLLVLNTGARLLVQEKPDMLISRYVEFRKRIADGIAGHGGIMPPPSAPKQSED
jgi:flagellar protein FlbD